jgi:DTW domain-containing protein YfiP
MSTSPILLNFPLEASDVLNTAYVELAKVEAEVEAVLLNFPLEASHTLNTASLESAEVEAEVETVFLTEVEVEVEAVLLRNLAGHLPNVVRLDGSLLGSHG